MKKRYMRYPRWEKIYQKYTLPRWWKKVKKEDFYKILATSLQYDFGSYYIDIDYTDEAIVIMYKGCLPGTFVKVYDQRSVDYILDELIYITSLYYSDDFLERIVREYEAV